ncbi:MAG: hypothetical protein EOP47_05015 [Sphingobacteriaceae bacterium]|nr:MAG: hypothetical protein EOP47_05015 [Sphingobacteriaceae bacterium]
MKILKSIFLGLAFTIAFTAAKADGKPTKAEVLNIFMDASAHGKMEKFEDVIAKDVEYNIQRGDRTIKTDRKQMIDFYKANQNVEQNCKCTTSTVEDNDRYMVVKMEMKYDTYTRVNLVTIMDTVNGWKVTKVNTSVVNNA